MKLSNLNVQQKFILKLLAENESFSIKKRDTKFIMFDGNNALFYLQMRTINNLLVLKKITEIKEGVFK